MRQHRCSNQFYTFLHEVETYIKSKFNAIASEWSLDIKMIVNNLLINNEVNELWKILCENTDFATDYQFNQISNNLLKEIIQFM
jgi:hypothetical protein